jgi:hypothetical protein
LNAWPTNMSAIMRGSTTRPFNVAASFRSASVRCWKSPVPFPARAELLPGRMAFRVAHSRMLKGIC